MCNNNKNQVILIFFTFYGQRSVTAAWATRSPWSISERNQTNCIMCHSQRLYIIITSNFYKLYVQGHNEKPQNLQRVPIYRTHLVLLMPILAQAACVRHAQLGHCYYHRSLFLFLFFFFFLRLVLTHFGESPVCENLFPPIIQHNQKICAKKMGGFFKKMGRFFYFLRPVFGHGRMGHPQSLEYCIKGLTFLGKLKLANFKAGTKWRSSKFLPSLYTSLCRF